VNGADNQGFQDMGVFKQTGIGSTSITQQEERDQDYSSVASILGVERSALEHKCHGLSIRNRQTDWQPKQIIYELQREIKHNF